MEQVKRFFKRFGKGLRSKGYTLMEVAGVVAVSATLAAVALPVVKDKMSEAKYAAAKQDMNNLAGAIQQYKGDTSLWPNASSAAVSGVSQTGNVMRTSISQDLVVTDASSGTGWSLDSNIVLEGVLAQNIAGRGSWKGPYSTKPELFDPWGHPYYVAIEDAKDFEGFVDDPNHSTAIFILSAGPNEKIDTIRKQDMQAFAKGGDDIVLRIR